MANGPASQAPTYSTRSDPVTFITQLAKYLGAHAGPASACITTSPARSKFSTSRSVTTVTHKNELGTRLRSLGEVGKAMGGKQVT